MFIAQPRGRRFQSLLFIKITFSSFALCLLAVAGPRPLHAEPLSFTAALALAERESPDLAARAASIEAARSAATAAGALPDPKLIVGIDNLPATGPDQWSVSRDFMTMRKIGVMQELPNAARRRAQTEVAAASIERVVAERRVSILNVRQATALAWLDRYYLEQRIALFDELERQNHLFAEVVQAQLAGDRGMPADIVAPQQEAAELADRRDALLTDVNKAKAILRRYVGVAGDQFLTSDAPLLSIDTMQLRNQVHQHAELAVFAPLLQMAQAEVHVAQAALKPDWGVELSYARRGAVFSDMVSMQLTVGLPLFTRTRQDPQITATRLAVTQVTAEREAMLREHTQALDFELADYELLSRQLQRMHDTQLPLAQQKVDYQFASYRAGKGDLTAVLTARRELVDARLKQLDLDSQRAATTARLYFAYGEGAR